MLSDDGIIYGLGKNQFGQLALGDTTDRTSFEEISLLKNKKIISVSCGEQFCIGLSGFISFKNFFTFKRKWSSLWLGKKYLWK